jgi:hypothetical protein
MAKNTPRFPTSQQIDKAMKDARKLNAFMASPEGQKLLRRAEALGAKLGQSAKPRPKKRRSKKKKEPAHYVKLSPDEVTSLTNAYRKTLKADPSSVAKQASAIASLRGLLPKQQRGVSDARLRRLILRATKTP